MGSGVSRILSGLYVSSFKDANSRKMIEEHEITHIVSAHDRSSRLHEDVECLCIQLSDTPDASISDHFIPVAKYIHKARRNNGKVLVHCLAGVSRSVTLVTAYVMIVGEVGWIDALKVVRCGRREANPNFGFKKQLRDFEANIAQVREEFRKEFPSQSESPDDMAECATIIADYINRLGFGDRLLAESEALLIDSCRSKREEEELNDDDHVVFLNGDSAEDRVPKRSSLPNGSTEEPNHVLPSAKEAEH